VKKLTDLIAVLGGMIAGLSGPGFLFTLLFTGLKLAHLTTFSWWMVFAPVWAPISVGLFLFLVGLLLVILFVK
jgi:hypothetical protein